MPGSSGGRWLERKRETGPRPRCRPFCPADADAPTARNRPARERAAPKGNPATPRAPSPDRRRRHTRRPSGSGPGRAPARSAPPAIRSAARAPKGLARARDGRAIHTRAIGRRRTALRAALGRATRPAQLRQKSGVKSTSTVNNSSRPNNIASDNTHLAASGRSPKWPAGPMIGPSPGPTFASAVTDADMAVM